MSKSVYLNETGVVKFASQCTHSIRRCWNYLTSVHTHEGTNCFRASRKFYRTSTDRVDSRSTLKRLTRSTSRFTWSTYMYTPQ